MNRYLDKVAGVAEDQARETIFKGNQEIRPYHNLTPEIRQSLETGAVAGSAYLGSQALSHVHPGFGKAAPGVALAAGLYNATGLGSKLKSSDREQERLISSLIRNRARDAQEEAKMQKSADDRGYFEPAAVGAVAGGITGGVLGGAVGISGGTMARDIQKKLADSVSSVPFVKDAFPVDKVPSRTRSILQGIGKGFKYGALAGAPLGASLFAYDHFNKNRSMENQYLHKMADDGSVSKMSLLPSVAGIGAVAGGIAGGTAGATVGAIKRIAEHDPGLVNFDKFKQYKGIAKYIGKRALKGAAFGVPLGAAGFALPYALDKTAEDSSYYDEDLLHRLKVGAGIGGGLGALMGGGINAYDVAKLHEVSPDTKLNSKQLSHILKGAGKVGLGSALLASGALYGQHVLSNKGNDMNKQAEVTLGQTVQDDGSTGAKLGVLAGGLHGLVRGGPVRAVGEGFVGGLGGLVAGSVAGIPHGLLRDSNAQRGSRSSLLRDVQSTTDSDVRTGASIGSKVGAGLGIIGGLGAGLAGASTLMQESKVPAGKALAGALGATAALGGLGYLSGGLGGAVGGMGVAVPHGAAKSLIKDYQNNKYLNKVAGQVSDTISDDAYTGAKLGILAGGIRGLTRNTTTWGTVLGASTGALGGAALGGIVGIPHGLSRDPNQPRRVVNNLNEDMKRAVRTDALLGLVGGAALGTVGGLETGRQDVKSYLKGIGSNGKASKLKIAGKYLSNALPGAAIGGMVGTFGGANFGIPDGAARSLYRDVKDANKLQKTAEDKVDTSQGGLGRMLGVGAGVGGVMGLGAGGLFGIVDHPFTTSQNTLLNRLKHSGSTALKMGAGTALGSAALMGSLYGLGSYQQSHKKQAEENWRPDSYAHRLGWEDPRKAALRSAALTGLSYAPYASDMKTGDKVMAGSMAALSASGAHSEAEMKNQILREILEAQEHGVRHGDMDLHHELKEEIMSDPESSKWAGRVLGGLVSAAAGGSLAHAVGGNGLAVGAGALAGGVLGGLGFGALGHHSAEADNRRVQGILDAREAYLRAKMVKQAEEAPEHSYKPALTAGAIDAGMGLGLGALGQQISKRYLGGKYTPLVIGGLEGTAAMAATDMYQRSHEAQMEELKARLRG